MVKNITITEEEIRALLAPIPDPEIPVITIEDLGILRDITIEGNLVTVKITPTYNGCPAMKTIEHDIIETLKSEGITKIKVELVYSPAWTTDWLTDAAKERLRIYGISPPENTADFNSLVKKNVHCPRCNSGNTILVSQFGSTACKALYKCEDCLEPFDHFKCH
jgi:ring-1,2-phenylacetyl-CoA epoxidase subunit PaaD